MDAQAFAEMCHDKLAHAEQILTTLLNGPRTAQGVLDPANAMATLLDAIASQSSLMQSVSPEPEMRAAAEKAEQEASRFATELSLHRGLFEAFAALDIKTSSADERRYVEHTLRDMRRGGVDKDEKTRARIRELNEEQVKNSQAFERNIREDVRETFVSATALAGLPADYIAAHAAVDGKVRITSDYPDYVPFMTYSEDPAARRELYGAFRQRGFPKNIAVLTSILEVRRELAQLLGYADWADYITETRMMKSGAAASTFIERIAAIAKPSSERELAMLLARKKQDDAGASEVAEWERGYYDEKVKRDSFAFNAQTVRPYFEYGRVREGVLATCAELFGVRFARVPQEAWHADVESYEVYDGQALVGKFQLDMHPRADKYKHAAQFTFQRGVLGSQIPIGVLVCNFPRAGELLDHKDVVTFFHEFGHLLHHIFGGGQRWMQFSGVATEWDFVEAPSQMLEEWAFDPDVLARFAKHHETGEVIPRELVKRMKAAEEYGKGIQARVQMFYAALSLELYRRAPQGLDSTALVKELQNRFSPFRYVEGTHFHCSFGHLDGYSAGYYTYMWSQVIAKDLLSAFQETHLMDVATARRYRDSVLAPGGSRDAAELVQQFLGRPYDEKAFGKWLDSSATA